MVNKYNQKQKEMLRKVARERYQNLSEEEKEKKGVGIIVNVMRISLKKEKEK